MLDLSKHKRYLLACSFGPDSMALFDMLIKEGFAFSVAHVNYHKRKESNSEEESLRKYCKDRNILLFVLDTNLLDKPKGNFQAWARKVRYNFFAECAQKDNCQSVLVAHHLDDAIETYLLQKKRNGYVEHYGLSKKTIIENTVIERPLLYYTKSELLQYCIDKCVPYSIDSSNLTNDYARNKIRHEIVEKMSRKEKDTLINKIDKLNDHSKEIQKQYEKLILTENINIEEFLKIRSLKVQSMVINAYLKKNNVIKTLSFAQVKELIKALKSNKPNVVLKLTKNTNLVKSYKFIKIVDNLNSYDYIYIVEKPCIVDTEQFTLNLENNVGHFRIKSDDFPLTIRPYKAGDLSFINNIKKKVARLYIDWKMPESLRKKWPLIFNHNSELIYIIRYYDESSLTADKDFIVKS